MRTLFLKGNQARHQNRRKALWVCLVLVLLVGAYGVFQFQGLMGRVVSAANLLGVTAVVLVLVLGVRGLHARRLKNAEQSLKDSALW